MAGVSLVVEPKVTPLRINFAWTITGNMVYAGCQWGMLVTLARLGSPSSVGQLALGLAVAAPVVMFSNLQLRTVQATDAFGEFAFRDYLGFRLITVVFGLLITAAIALLTHYPPETAFVIIALAFAKCFDASSDIVYGLFQQRERMDQIAKSMLIKGPLSLAAFALVFKKTGSVGWSAMALAAVWALVFLFYDLRNAVRVLHAAHPSESQIRPRWQVSKLANLAKLGLPLGLLMLMISLNANVPRYFIQHYLGARQLGIFASLAYLPTAASLVVEAVGQSATARLSRYYALNRLKAFKRLTFRLVGIGVVLGIFGVIVAGSAGRPVLNLLYGAEYGRHARILFWLIGAGGIAFVSSFVGYAITATRHFYAPLPMLVLMLLASALGCVWLIPAHGLLGVTFALTISACVQLISYILVLIYVLKTRKDTDCAV